MTSRDSWFGRFRGTHARAVRGLLCVFAASLVVLALVAPVALASGESFTWSGLASKGPEWSLAENWEGDAAPTPGAEIETLTFPRLTTPPCSNEEFELTDLTVLQLERPQRAKRRIDHPRRRGLPLHRR